MNQHFLLRSRLPGVPIPLAGDSLFPHDIRRTRKQRTNRFLLRQSGLPFIESVLET